MGVKRTRRSLVIFANECAFDAGEALNRSLRAHFELTSRSLRVLLALLPVSFQAERRERVEILRGMIAHKIDRPRADEKKRRRDG